MPIGDTVFGMVMAIAMVFTLMFRQAIITTVTIVMVITEMLTTTVADGLKATTMDIGVHEKFAINPLLYLKQFPSISA